MTTEEMRVTPIPAEKDRYFVQSQSRPDVQHVVDMAYVESPKDKRRCDRRRSREQVKRAVIKTETFYNPGYEKHWAVGGSKRLTLECGHEKTTKLSQPTPRKVFCTECSRLQSGNGHCTRFNRATKTAHWQTWNDVRKMPEDHERLMTTAEIAEWSQ